MNKTQIQREKQNEQQKNEFNFFMLIALFIIFGIIYLHRYLGLHKPFLAIFMLMVSLLLILFSFNFIIIYFIFYFS